MADCASEGRRHSQGERLGGPEEVPGLGGCWAWNPPGPPPGALRGTVSHQCPSGRRMGVPESSHTGTWQSEFAIGCGCPPTAYGRTVWAVSDELVDPFAGLVDDPDPGPAGTRDQLLNAALRGFVPVRKVFVQKPKGSSERASMLARLVSGHHHRPLDAFLLLHALQPILEGSPLDLGTWARILSTGRPCTPAAASKAFAVLVDLQLAKRTGTNRRPVIQPLREDGEAGAWSKPGLVEEEGPGYFTLPHNYWTDGFVDELTLPGKAMLLILLAETQNPKTPAFNMAVERAHAWYGISERTAERGHSELSKQKLLLVKRTKKADPRHPAGRRDVYWRALRSPFATDDRARLQQAAKKGVGARGTDTSGPARTEPTAAEKTP